MQTQELQHKAKHGDDVEREISLGDSNQEYVSDRVD